jgi:hypothetical protein
MLIDAEKIETNGAANKAKFTISGVPDLDTSGVRQGQAVRNIHEYRIFLETRSNGETSALSPFKIWNFGMPGTAGTGMKVSKTYPAIEVADNGDDDNGEDGMVSLKHLALNDANKIYVLADTILISAAHSPIGTAAQPFKGTLYGAGKSITLGNGFTGASVSNAGLFGVSGGDALIRDLVVIYTGTNAAAGAADTNVGGITGLAGQNTRILNSIVKGADSNAAIILNPAAGSNPVRLGGIVGYLGNAVTSDSTDTASIQNCLVTLNLALSGSCGSGQDHLAGGVVAYSLSNGAITELSSAGTVTLDTSGSSAAVYCGGIGGMIIDTALDSIEWSGTLNIPSTYTSNTDLYTGGIAGDFYGYTRTVRGSDCTGTGAIEYQSRKISGTTNIGGLFGRLYAADGSTAVTVSASSYSGRIDMDNGTVNYSGNLNLGGFAGSITKWCETSTCSASAAVAVSKSGNGTIFMGGFVGNCGGAELSNSHAAGSLTLRSAPTSSFMYIGGFAGYALNGNGTTTIISDCSASGDVSAAGNHVLYIGGFVGGSAHAGSGTGKGVIERCLATGNVNTIHLGSALFYAGGLVGGGEGLDISDSYALGDVFAYRQTTSGNVFAGGLAGNVMYISSALAGSMDRCFAAGSVTAQANDGSSMIYAGGLVGQATNSAVTIDNSAALGARVIATGGTTRNAGRVTGDSTGTRANCYAWNGILTDASAAYGAYVPGAPVTTGIGVATKEGANAGTGDFKVQSWWGSLGFTAANGWDHTYTVRDGRPALK